MVGGAEESAQKKSREGTSSVTRYKHNTIRSGTVEERKKIGGNRNEGSYYEEYVRN